MYIYIYIKMLLTVDASKSQATLPDVPTGAHIDATKGSMYLSI